MADSDTHRAKTLGDRQGWYQKNMEGNPKNSKKDYNGLCKAKNKGYFGPRWNAHHILPKTSFDRSIEGNPSTRSTHALSAVSTEDAKFIRDLMWITPWNMDDKDKNLIGMPHLNAFMMSFSDLGDDNVLKEEGETGYMAGKRVSFNNKTVAERQTWKEQLDAAGSPAGHCIHQYVNWGHTEYNREVGVALRKVWNKYVKKRDAHVSDPRDLGIDPNTVKTDIENVGTAFDRKLSTRGKKATEANWKKRLTVADWYKNFTMTAGWNPLTGQPE